jgi:hypothetical protein
MIFKSKSQMNDGILLLVVAFLSLTVASLAQASSTIDAGKAKSPAAKSTVNSGLSTSIEEGYRNIPEKKNLISVKSFSSKKFGKVFAIHRNDGELLGRQDIIEVRAACASASPDWHKLAVGRMVSACRASDKNFTFDGASETIKIEYFDADADLFNKESKEDIKTPEPKCLSERTKIEFRLSEICKTASSK